MDQLNDSGIKLHTLRLSDQALQIISTALGEMPAKVSFSVITEINRQLAANAEMVTVRGQERRVDEFDNAPLDGPQN